MKTEESPETFVTRRQLITTCLSSAAGAVILGWLLARPDVWALQNSIERLATVVRELKVNQNQNVSIGYDRNQTIRDILDRKIVTNGLHAPAMRGTSDPAANPAAGTHGNQPGNRNAGIGTHSN